MRRLALLLGCMGVLALALAVVTRAIPPEHFPVSHVDDTDIFQPPRTHVDSRSRPTA
jgi:hypothetical protein